MQLALAHTVQPMQAVRSLLSRALSAIRRNNGTLIGIPDNFAGTYIDSTGTTPVTAVGDLVGLLTDRSYGAGNLGVELVTNGDFSNGATGWSIPAGWSLGSGVVTATAASGSLKQLSTPYIAGKTYKVEFDWSHTSGTLYARVGTGTAVTFTSSGRKSVVLVATNTAGIEFYGGSVTGTVDNISVREVLGNHATQGATANKGILRRNNGRLCIEFDATDSLVVTLPAGFSAATVIDARSTGQVTLQNQNIVGAYSIGPSQTWFGRIILPSSPSASDLALLQRFANSLAGL